MYSQSLLKSKKLNYCLKTVFYNVILISKKKDNYHKNVL